MSNTSPLRQYREAEGLTLEALATRFGVNKSTLMRWEEDEARIPADRVVEVEAKTGISRHVLRPDLAKIFAGRAA